MKPVSRLIAAAVLGSVFGAAAAAQDFKAKPPTAADWAALAKLPDFNGVWEAGTVGGGGRGAAPAEGRGAGPAGGRGSAEGRGGAEGRGAAPARGRGGAPGGPQLTPAYEAKRQ